MFIEGLLRGAQNAIGGRMRRSEQWLRTLKERSQHKSSLIKLFAHFRHIVNIHSLTLTINFSKLWKTCYRFTHVFSHCIKLRALPLAAVISLHYLPRCLCSKLHAAKNLLFFH